MPLLEEMKKIKKETGFNSTQIKRLFRRFHALDKGGKGYLTKEDLMQVNEVILFNYVYIE